MLSDEEKEAIEYLKRHIIPCYGRKGTIEFMLNDTLLNLIEKQSKEIEELKNGQIDFWISDKEIEDRIKNKFTSNDKIKARIKELEEYLYKGNIKDDFLMIRIKAKIQELQLLLKKE